MVSRFKSRARRDRRRPCAILASLTVLAVCIALFVSSAYAGDLSAEAKRMSDQAFALLNSLNAGESHGSPNPALAPTASFASDSQALADAIAHGDMSAASSAAAALQSDKAAVDAIVARNPSALNQKDWKDLAGQLDSITTEISRTTGRAVTAAANPAPSAAIPSTAAVAPSAPVSAPATAAPSVSSAAGGPIIMIQSRQRDGDVVHIKGYMEGTALQSAGIYEDGQRLKSFKVSGVPGKQKVEFDIGLRDPGPATTLRLTDNRGRSAEAHVLDLSAAAEIPPASASIPADVGVETGPEPPPPDAGIEVDRSSRSGGVASDNTETIPSHGAPLPSPSKRHALGGNLANVHINVLATTQTQSMPPTYDVVGQIAGRGITRAGIYVNGRLAKRIPIVDGADYTSFDRTFVMQNGAASIRAYGVGGQFVESSLDLSGATTAPAIGMAPGVAIGAANPSGLVVEITSVRPIRANLYQVGGFISGPNLASAGLYQNGMLLRNLNIGGGISGMLGALLPGGTRSANFSTTFNPYAGQASIRAFSTDGAFTEQPIVIAGVNPTTPYAGAINPYGYAGAANPYGYANPYMSVSPFGMATSPYYGAAPMTPYVGGVSPYATRPAPATRPLW
jgi:hypothetical protein